MFTLKKRLQISLTSPSWAKRRSYSSCSTSTCWCETGSCLFSVSLASFTCIGNFLGKAHTVHYYMSCNLIGTRMNLTNAFTSPSGPNEDILISHHELVSRKVAYSPLCTNTGGIHFQLSLSYDSVYFTISAILSTPKNDHVAFLSTLYGHRLTPHTRNGIFSLSLYFIRFPNGN